MNASKAERGTKGKPRGCRLWLWCIAVITSAGELWKQQHFNTHAHGPLILHQLLTRAHGYLKVFLLIHRNV